MVATGRASSRTFTTVNAGTLTLANGGGAGAVRGMITVNSGATLNLTAGDAPGYNTDGTQVSSVNLHGGALTASAGNEGYVTSFVLTGGTVSGTSTFRFNVAGAGAPTISSLASGTTSTFASNIDDHPSQGAGGSLCLSVAKGTTAAGGAK